MAYNSRVQDKETLLKDALKAKSGLSGAWLLCGQEEYLSRYYLELVRKKVIPDPDMGYFDHIRLSGSEAGGRESFDAPASLAEKLRDACSGLPVMNEGKLVEITEPCFLSMSQSALNDFCGVIASLSDYPYVTVVLACAEEEFPTDRRAQTGALWRALEGAGMNIVPFARQNEQKLGAWCARHFAHEGITADSTVISAMLHRCGNSMSALSGEMQKLCYYEKAHGRTAVSAEDVLLVASQTEEAKEFGVQNAVRARDVSALLRECAVEKHAKGDPAVIFFQISSAVSEIQRVRSALADGMPREEIMRAFKIREYPLMLDEQAGNRYSQAELNALMTLCAETDCALKSSPVDGFLLVERLCCRFRAPEEGI